MFYVNGKFYASLKAADKAAGRDVYDYVSALKVTTPNIGGHLPEDVSIKYFRLTSLFPE